jgi:pyruvate dehydrogenase E2 component (dihydrolipoamide acetyltransferase)
MYGVRQFEAIINPPQAAILAVGTANRCPIALGNEVAIATMVTCNLSADHRLIDGAVGAKFLSNVKQLLENPLSLLS